MELHVGLRTSGTVEAYTSDGQGIVRLSSVEGTPVVFLPGGVRGDIVELEITKLLKHAAVGQLLRVLSPSPYRKAPDCPYFDRCGGCAFRHITYEEELRAKRQRVQDALTRIGGADVEVDPVLPAPNPLRYRNKAQFPVSSAGIGFYQAGSHRVVPVSDCLLLPEPSVQSADTVRNWMLRYRVPPYDERTGKGLLRHVYVRTNRAGESLCCIVANGSKLPREPELTARILKAVPKTVGVVLNSQTARSNVVLGPRFRTIWGQDCLTDTLHGQTFRLSVPSFYQVNAEQAEILYDKALEFAALTGTETVLDLYCGIGTLTLCLAGQARRTIGVEIVKRAVQDAKENAAENHVQNVEFHCADASEMAAQLVQEGLRPDVVTVDPPRKGLSEEAVAAVASMKPSRVVYVSCDPGTLGRDVRRFQEWGYCAVRAAAVDLFPSTAHVESVVLLSRQKPDDR